MASPSRLLSIDARLEPWVMAAPLVISGYRFDALQFLVVTLGDGVSTGRGEAAGVYYRGETPELMLEEIGEVRSRIAEGISRDDLRELLPPGGARNAVDCALWDLESRQRQTSVWALADVPDPTPRITTMTLSAASPDTMAAEAVDRFPQAHALKLKLLGDGQDAHRVAAVRAARPEVWLGVDANQGFDRHTLAEALPHLVAANVALIEQPFKVGDEALLDDLACPIAIAADESVRSLNDLDGLVGRVQVVNIKLDKCGGLTEALMMARRARTLGFKVMVGTMPATSLAIAPAFIVGQLCNIVDLDAPSYLSRDREITATYVDGMVDVPAGLWGWSA